MTGCPSQFLVCSKFDQFVSAPPAFWYTLNAVPTRNCHCPSCSVFFTPGVETSAPTSTYSASSITGAATPSREVKVCQPGSAPNPSLNGTARTSNKHWLCGYEQWRVGLPCMLLKITTCLSSATWVALPTGTQCWRRLEVASQMRQADNIV